MHSFSIRYFFIFIQISFFSVGLIFAQTGNSQNITYQSSVDNVQMGAVVWRPRNFDPQGPRVPLFIYLHGGGGTGQVLLNPSITAELDNRGWVGIAPDGRRWGLANLGCPWQTSSAYVDNPDPNVGPGERDILDAIEWAKANFPIDPDRIYLGGFSMGGRGAYQIGLRNPDIFAAIAPFSPASDMYEIFVRRPDPEVCKEGMVGGRPGDSSRVDTMYSITSGRFLIENAYNLPVYHGHGTLDNVAYNIPTVGDYQHGSHMLSDISWNGCHGSTPLCFGHTPTLSQLRTRHSAGYDWAFMFSPVGHNADSRWFRGTQPTGGVTGTADPQNPGNLIGSFEFLSRRQLQRNPETIVYKSYTDTHRKSYWSEILISTPWQDVPGAIRATRNNTNNLLDVELSRVSSATFDLPLAGLQLSPQSPLTVMVKNLNEPVFDPALLSIDEPLEPRIILKGNFAGLNNIRVARDGIFLPASQVIVTSDRITIGPLFVGSPTTLTITAQTGGSVLNSIRIYRKVQEQNNLYAGDLGRIYRIVLSGVNFQAGSKIVINGIEKGANLSANGELTVYSPFTMRVPNAQTLTIQVKNTDGSLSNPLSIEIVNR